MNIIEAFQMGGRVKRSGWDEYYTPSELLATRNLLPNAILANDWEVEERDVSITASDFDRAWNRAQMDPLAYVHYYGQLPMFETIINEFKDRVKKELGL